MMLGHYQKLLFFAFNRFKGDNYRLLREYYAQIVIDELERFTSLDGKKILDVGGAKGEFCAIFEQKRDCFAVNIDIKPEANYGCVAVMGQGTALPFFQDIFDIVLCRGVIEHIPYAKQLNLIREAKRVVKPGGICYIMTQPRWNPHAGHHMKPFHILPFRAAKFFRELFFRNKISGHSYADNRLYLVTFRHMIQLLNAGGLRYLCGLDTHLRMHFMTRLPLLREIAVPSVAFIATKQDVS